MKKNTFIVDFILPDDREEREFLRTKTNRVNKVYDQINSALMVKYGLMIGDLKSIKVYKHE